MTTKSKSLRSVYWLSAIVLFACFCAQSALYAYLRSDSARFMAEQRNEITINRLTNVEKLTGNTVILGSSLSERLTPTPEFGALCVPRSSFLGGMQYLHETSYKPGDLLILEVNFVTADVDNDVIESVRKHQEKPLSSIPNFTISARPSNLLMTTLFHLFTTEINVDDMSTCFEEKDYLDYVEATDVEITAQEQLVFDSIEQNLKAGYIICLVMHPFDTDIYGTSTQNINFARLLRKKYNLPFLNYAGAEFTPQLSFTDKVHLHTSHPKTHVYRNTLFRDAKRAVELKEQELAPAH